MWMIIAIVAAFVSYGLWEHYSHQSNLKRIPLRIHVNGTRGKSSVVRLICGGLRAGGLKILAKTTGTQARILLVNGQETPFFRLGAPKIIEQKKVVKEARKQKANCLVVECMGIQPHLQEFLERRLIRSHIGVITNVRLDHIDVMGGSLEEIAFSLASTIPKGGDLFTAEKNCFELIKNRCFQLGAEIHSVDARNVDDADMKGFSYLEHRENVSLALAVCEHLGIRKEIALEGMKKILPDVGALRWLKIRLDGKEIEFINAFAANDPDSLKVVWNMLEDDQRLDRNLIILAVCRKDRIWRTEQFASLVLSWSNAHCFVLAGERTFPFVNRAKAIGLPSCKLWNLQGKSAKDIFDKITDLSDKASLVLGVGNIVGLGEEIAELFKSKGE